MLLHKLGVLFIGLIFACTVQANTVISLGSGMSMPPYVIADKNRGIAIDLFRAAMAEENIETVVSYDDNRSIADKFNNNSIDAIFIANKKVTPNAYFSELPLIVFHNFAIALQSSDVTLNTSRDLRYYRLGAFRLAKKLLPPPFASATEHSPDYREYKLQIEQVQDLFRGERQVQVMDQTIFRYYLSQLRHQQPGSDLYRQEFKYYDLFPKSRYFAVFHTLEMKQAFDRGFAKVLSSGKHQRILQTYQALLSDYLFR